MPHDLQGVASYESKYQHKLTAREVNAATSAHEAVPNYLRWSEAAITFDRVGSLSSSTPSLAKCG